MIEYRQSIEFTKDDEDIGALGVDGVTAVSTDRDSEAVFCTYYPCC